MLLKQPSLYIFDEATSSLDHATEKLIMNNISHIIKKSMSIIIAHRLSTIIDAHEILVFNNGIIEERGTHFSLLSQGGLYAASWKSYEETNKGLDVA